MLETSFCVLMIKVGTAPEKSRNSKFALAVVVMILMEFDFFKSMLIVNIYKICKVLENCNVLIILMCFLTTVRYL